MAVQLENSLREAEEHLLRAEAELAQAALKLATVAGRGCDPRLSQLADVVATHKHLVHHLATITVSILCSGLDHEPVSRLPGHRLTQTFF